MANPTIGHVTCPFTGERAEVCRAKTGKHPLYYRGQKCGIVHGKAAGFQEWVLENATIDAAPSLERPTPAAEVTPPPIKEPKPARNRGFLDAIFGDDDD